MAAISIAQHASPILYDGDLICPVNFLGWGGVCHGLMSNDSWNFHVLSDRSGVVFSTRLAVKLRRATTVQRLLHDQGTVLELLSRLSWLGVLLGAATFTAALAPPGGCDSGLLFLNYSAADCGGVNQTERTA
jgi:hypothetical protein